jgi:glucose/arabinose dehydrogenase
MKRFSSIAAGLLAAALFASLVAFPPAPAQAQSGGPKPPITDPNLLGKPKKNTPAAEVMSTGGGESTAAASPNTIKTMTDIAACLAKGETAYGVTIQTTNVRSAPSTEACRYGKLAKATLVEIADFQVVKAASAATPPAAAAPTASGPTLGYVEDIQPLFERSCTACHSAAAKTLGLQTTAYGPLMTGSQNGPVIVPGNPDASKLWEMVSQGKMPATGPLPPAEQELVRDWILQGAAERRAASPATAVAAPAGDSTWFTLANAKLQSVPDACQEQPAAGSTLASADLIIPVSCGVAPTSAQIRTALAGGRTATNSGAASPAAAGTTTAAAVATDAAAAAAPALEARPAARGASAGGTGIEAAAFGLPSPTEADPYLVPAGFCIERRRPDNTRGITAISFAPDGRMFLALDSDLAHEVDPLILYDAYHPSRSIAVYDWANDMTPVEIMSESSRITGLDYVDGSLYVSRAGEVGRIPDGSSYETLAGGFAVSSQLFHANNGIVVDNGWVYVSAGGVRDGYVEGPIVGVGEAGAQDIVSGGNGHAARIVRAPLDALLTQKSISAFTTAARGVRNPYGITADPGGRIWFTDNGATNVPDEIAAGDEVNVLDPGIVTGEEGSSPYYGFPLALSGSTPDWYSAPALTLVNSAAPTGITYAYDTIFFGEYGRNPGVYRVAKTADGTLVGERIMMAWPVLALATAPDGALWVGMGDGGLYRMTPGCN